MAEYGRHDRLTSVVRFINDILLSAPSIVIGLFIYEVMVVSDGPFLRLGRRGRARGDRHPGGRAHHRGHADAGAGHAARGRRLDRPAALADDHAHRLPRRQGRHGHRRAARGRAHQRRDRAAAVHRAQQPVLEHQPERADGEPAGRHLPVRAQPLQGLAGAGLDRRADHHLGRARAQHHRARSCPHRENSHERRHDRPPRTPTVTHAAGRHRRSRRADFDPRPQLLLRRQPGAEGHHACRSTPAR